MDRTFSHCASLTSLDLTHFDTSKVTNMHKMFSECFKLVDLNISNFNTSKVEIMDYMFSNGFLLTLNKNPEIIKNKAT
jgi:surface protein